MQSTIAELEKKGKAAKAASRKLAVVSVKSGRVQGQGLTPAPPVKDPTG